MEHILFVDDDPQIATLVERVLKHQGYHVDAYTSSDAALKTFVADPDVYDLVITDQSMPGLTGYELSREMLNRRDDILIILMTGYSETITPEKAEQIGIKGYIMKPFDVTELSNAVRTVISKPPIPSIFN